MLRSVVCVVCVVVLALWGVSAQDSTKSALTASEQSRVEVLELKSQLTKLIRQNQDLQAAYGQCQAQLGPLQEQVNQGAIRKDADTLKADIENAHPGYVWTPEGGLVKK